MTGGWAATNTLREHAGGDFHLPTCRLTGYTPCSCGKAERDAALALVEAALDAGNEVAEAHKDFRFVCSRDDTEALDVLAAALRAVREGR